MVTNQFNCQQFFFKNPFLGILSWWILFTCTFFIRFRMCVYEYPNEWMLYGVVLDHSTMHFFIKAILISLIQHISIKSHIVYHVLHAILLNKSTHLWNLWYGKRERAGYWISSEILLLCLTIDLKNKTKKTRQAKYHIMWRGVDVKLLPLFFHLNIVSSTQIHFTMMWWLVKLINEILIIEKCFRFKSLCSCACMYYSCIYSLNSLRK